MQLTIHCDDCEEPVGIDDKGWSGTAQGSKLRKNVFLENGMWVNRIYLNNKLIHSCIADSVDI